MRQSARWIRPHGIGFPESYAMPDPTCPRRSDVAWKVRHEPQSLTKTEGCLAAEALEAYHHLLTHPAGTEVMIRKLREVRRKIKEASP